MAQLLILGGTRFLGRHLAEQALQAGHQLTLLHRGQTSASLFPQARHLITDRDSDLSALAALGTHWDAVFDTSAYVPRQVHQVAAALRGRVGQYQLVSSISVYRHFEVTGTGESAPLHAAPEPPTEDITGATYGALKAQCEHAALAAFGTRCVISRPGLLVGPHDPTGRFTWWVQRLLRGGEVLAPGDPAGPVQFIDARDVAAWMLLQATQGNPGGAFNLNGPDRPLTMGLFLDAARALLNPGAQLHWVDEALLLQHAVKPWVDLPVWLDAASCAMHRIDCAAARATGLHCRALQQTLHDTAAWAQQAGVATDPASTPPGTGGTARPAVGLASAREAALLQAQKARSG